MNALRIQTVITADTLCLPELKLWKGKKVEIIVVEAPTPHAGAKRPAHARKAKARDFSHNFGAGWPDDIDDGFEEAVARWRRDDKLREPPL
ncbi:MAG: hypothetical protein ABSE73_14375 [Planctomycetota bacterium]